jgi:hypothetical protein
VAAAQRAGLHVHAAQVAGQDRPDLGRGAAASRHLTVSRGFEVAWACATGMPPEQVMRALQAEAPLLVPHGRRLRGAEIRAALAGRRLRGLEWEPTMNVLSVWGEDGTLGYLTLGQVARPLAQWRWRVEGDRLCTTRHGCGEVLAQAGALHLVVGQSGGGQSGAGQPARLRLTLLAEPGPGAAERRGRGARGATGGGAGGGAEHLPP